MGFVLVLLSVIAALIFAFSGGIKVFGVERSLVNRDRFRLSPSLWRTIGWLEWAGAVGVLVGLVFAPLGAAAALGLCALMVGAVMNRFRVHDPAVAVSGDAAVLA